MWLFLLCCLSLQSVNSLWDKEITCPRLCMCRLEHITETAIHRFMQKDINKEPVPEAVILESNDVFYNDEFNEFDSSSFIRSATCIVQTETPPEELVNELPKEIQSVTLIQASDSGNKSIKFSYFNKFPELKILELLSAQKLKQGPTSHFICDVEAPLEQLEYLNLERVLLKTTKKHYKLENEEEITFEYVQRADENLHSLTFVQHGPQEKILPYKTYVETHKNTEVPLFVGFTNLFLLRISECDLNSIQWEMFEGLGNLNYLLLEKNKLRFIPDFAFYGTPNLKSLSLAYNDLLNIQITDLAGLLELEYLDLSHNNFSQLSELSLPPFPKLKLANFADNPITVVFPSTFEVMNTTDSLILGGLDEPLSLLPNSFLGLKLLRTLTLLQLNIPLLKREILVGMPNLHVLSMTGNIPEIQYDAFLEVVNLETLLLSKCNITKLSMDAFIGLSNLQLLDLSRNNLDFLPPSIFDDLTSIKEIYLNNNKFTSLPKDIFIKLHAKLIRLNENPWHCSCDMSDWKPIIVNRIKQKSIKACDNRHDKGVGCTTENKIYYKYVYENRVAPKCNTPKKYENWSVFHVMRKQFKCAEFKPKLKKKINKNSGEIHYSPLEKIKLQLGKLNISEVTVETTSVENTKDFSPLDKIKLQLTEKLNISAIETIELSSTENKDNAQTTENYSTEDFDSKSENMESLSKTSNENYGSENFDKLSKLEKLNRKLARELKLNNTIGNPASESGGSEDDNNNLVPANIPVKLNKRNGKKIRKIKKRINKQAIINDL